MGGALVIVATAACGLIDLSDLRGDGGADGAAAPDVLTVKCKTQSPCVVPGYCCATCNSGTGCNFTFACETDAAACGSSGVVIGCSDPGSCAPNQVCCGMLGSSGSYFEGSSCRTRPECDASAPSVELCDPNVSNPCPFGGQCLLSNTADFADLFECR